MENRKTNIKILISLLLLVAFTFGLRAFAISDRPLHNDEGVNFYFVKPMLNSGIYNYSHKNYHGPSYFYLLASVVYLFGDSEFSVRLASILPSLFLIPFLLISFNYVSITARIIAGLFLAVSTTFLYYSRYSIHETLLVLSCVLGIHFLFKWLLLKRHRDLIYLFITFGLAISTKETFIIHFFALGIAAFCVFSLPVVLRSLFRNKPTISWGILFSSLIIILFYSGFLRSFAGIKELFLGVPQWVGRGYSDKGHHKPFDYYVELINTTEPVALLGFIPALFFLFKTSMNVVSRYRKSELRIGRALYKTLFPENRFIFTAEEKASYMFSVYALVSMLVYSYVPYKTPWLIINVTVPSLIALSFFLTSQLKNKMVFILVATGLFFNSTLTSLRYNYLPESLGPLNRIVKSQGIIGELNPLAYVHTHPGMVELANKIVNYSKTHPSTRVLIGTKAYWPLPYYLREIAPQLMYAQDSDPNKYFDSYSIIIVNREWDINKIGWEKEYVKLSDNQESYVYFARDH